jgi:hypothetical protein
VLDIPIPSVVLDASEERSGDEVDQRIAEEMSLAIDKPTQHPAAGLGRLGEDVSVPEIEVHEDGRGDIRQRGLVAAERRAELERAHGQRHLPVLRVLEQAVDDRDERLIPGRGVGTIARVAEPAARNPMRRWQRAVRRSRPGRSRRRALLQRRPLRQLGSPGASSGWSRHPRSDSLTSGSNPG